MRNEQEYKITVCQIKFSYPQKHPLSTAETQDSRYTALSSEKGSDDCNNNTAKRGAHYRMDFKLPLIEL